MKRGIIAALFVIGLTGAFVVPVSAAEAEVPSSPLYSSSEGLITGLVTIIVFIVLLVVLGKYAWAPILTGLKNREDKIRKDIADAEATRARAEATLRDYTAQLATAEQKVRDMLNKAATDAEKLAAGIRTHAQQEAEETKERALKDIESARVQAVAQVYEQAADLATRVAEKILRRELKPEDQRDLVDRSLEKVSGVSQN
jgi:F-type H+-transporting ATPase subunit b